MYQFNTVTEATEAVEAARDALESAEMQYDVALIVHAEPTFIEETERALAAAWSAYCESMEDLTDTENHAV